jgi:peptidyl-prolyl cis-trans isomerase C
MRSHRRWTNGALVAWMTLASLLSVGGVQAQSSRRARPVRAAADSVLVRIGRDAITTGMVQRRLEELPEHVRPQFTTPEGRQRLLDRMVEERVWLSAATRQGVQDRPEIRRQIEQQRRDLLIRTYINEVMADNPAPSDSEAQAYFNAHQSDYRTPATVTLSHIQTKNEADAKRVRQSARNQDWAKLVSRYSTDTLTKSRGGSLGTVTLEGVFGHLGKQSALAESAFALGAGKVGGPYRTDRGWHVIKVESVKPEGVRPFEQARASIMRQLSSQRSQERYQAQLAKAKATLGVRTDSTAIRKFVSQRKSAREVFNEAQLAGGPAERIEAYRRVLSEHADSDVGPQAQFMIGFIQSEELKDYAAAEASFKSLLDRYPRSELAASARWMLTHMRSESAPEFMNLESDSGRVAGDKNVPDATGKP